MNDAASWVSVARLLRPQGRHGEILAEILTDFPERFERMQGAFLARDPGGAPTPVAIERSWLHKGRVVLKLAQVDSISAAESLRGAELMIPVAERVPLEPEAAYIGDLTGCELIDRNQAANAVVGTIQDVIQQNQATDLLVVLGGDGVEHWIPFAKAYLPRVDVDQRRVEMHLPPGLLEVNAPLSEEERNAHQREAAGENPSAEPVSEK